jgi:hypothetical protein
MNRPFEMQAGRLSGQNKNYFLRSANKRRIHPKINKIPPNGVIG